MQSRPPVLRARTLFARFDASWAHNVVRPNGDPVELAPRSKAYVVRRENGRRVLDVMSWDVLGGGAAYPMTNVRDLGRWRAVPRAAASCR